jgi:broad specificity phosphatase PhoE
VLIHFLTHPEVDIDPELSVVEWGLNQRGRERARLVARALPHVRWIYSSPEIKAEQTARLIGEELGLGVTLVGGLAEIDRAATGYLPEPEFWANYQEFIDRPSYSARGWETADDAQQRIVSTVEQIVEQVVEQVVEQIADGLDDELEDRGGEVALVSHGGVGALLLSRLRGVPIQRLSDQPGQGSHFSFESDTGEIVSGWAPFESLTDLQQTDGSLPEGG